MFMLFRHAAICINELDKKIITLKRRNSLLQLYSKMIIFADPLRLLCSPNHFSTLLYLKLTIARPIKYPTKNMAIDAKTIAVGTGNYSVEKLTKYNPDAVFLNLKDNDKFISVIRHGK